jgi:sugar-specific transcriptional regulator TrmB
MKTAISTLTRLGLTDYEARAYITLLRENPLTAYEISKNSGIPSSKVYEVIKRMETKQIVQSIHGERSKMFIPTSPDEFIESFRTEMEDSLYSVKTELRGFKVARATRYTWHINDYEGLIAKARRIIETTQKNVLLSTWRQEVEVLTKSLNGAEKRGVKIAIIHYGAPNIKCGQLYRHPIEDKRFSKGQIRGFSLVADSKEALIGKIEGKETEAIWSMNEGFVMIAEDYIRHDIYIMKIVKRFDPSLRGKFGFRYEKLIDVYTDEEIKK